jgi:hypothetical protein
MLSPLLLIIGLNKRYLTWFEKFGAIILLWMINFNGIKLNEKKYGFAIYLIALTIVQMFYHYRYLPSLQAHYLFDLLFPTS